jgi:predicted dehydrogenase
MTAHLLPDETGYQPQQARSQAQGIKITPEPQNIYRAEIEAFSAALLAGTPNPLPAELGLRSQKLIAACYQSASTGRAVSV